MNLLKVESTHIAAIGWQKDFKYKADKPAKDTLRVLFHSRQVYDYLDVPESTFKAFLNAQSKGRFFDSKIVNRYTTLKRRIKVEDE